MERVLLSSICLFIVIIYDTLFTFWLRVKPILDETPEFALMKRLSPYQYWKNQGLALLSIIELPIMIGLLSHVFPVAGLLLFIWYSIEQYRAVKKQGKVELIHHLIFWSRGFPLLVISLSGII